MCFYGGSCYLMTMNDSLDSAGDIGSKPQQSGEAGGGDSLWSGQSSQSEAQPQQPDPAASQPEPALPETEKSRRDIQRHVTKTQS